MKTCTKCKTEKIESEFYKDKQKRDGLSSQCRECRLAYKTAYAKKNRKMLAEKSKIYASKRKEHKAEYDREYTKKNKERISKRKAEWHRKDREANPEKYRLKKELWRRKQGVKPRAVRTDEEKDLLKKSYRMSPAPYEVYGDKIPVTDHPVEDESTGHLLVTCTNCKKLFTPTRSQVGNRLSALSRDYRGESNFYCADECRESCTLYNFSPERHYDPRLTREGNRARSCQTDSLKQLQCDEVGHNYCERCGDIVDVELHHTHPVAQFKNEAINSAGHMLLCLHCHKELHSSC